MTGSTTRGACGRLTGENLQKDKFSYDLRALFENIKRGEARLQATGLQLISPPPNPASLPNSALHRLVSFAAALARLASAFPNDRLLIVTGRWERPEAKGVTLIVHFHPESN
ncbi:MAG: hypothetical protein WAV07_01420 [Candidatus Contendobacter sp.]